MLSRWIYFTWAKKGRRLDDTMIVVSFIVISLIIINYHHCWKKIFLNQPNLLSATLILVYLCSWTKLLAMNPSLSKVVFYATAGHQKWFSCLTLSHLYLYLKCLCLSFLIIILLSHTLWHKNNDTEVNNNIGTVLAVK